jgi:hypothetical protein
MWQIGGQPTQIGLRLSGEYSVQPLVELFERQPAVCVMLPQFGSDSVALLVPDAQTRLSSHLPSVPLARSLIMKRYIASRAAATQQPVANRGVHAGEHEDQLVRYPAH